MALPRKNPTESPKWQELKTHYQSLKNAHMLDLFKEDPQRTEKLSIDLDEMLLDFSKNRLTQDTLNLLIDLARDLDLEAGIDKLFKGELINETEHRAVMHMALRAPKNKTMTVDGENVVEEVHQVLDKMKAFTARLDNKTWKGYTGKDITDVVNIGIGGSDLGPVMVAEALTPYHRLDRQVHFVSNVDGAHISQTLAKLDPETTLFIIASKTFTTIETMTNAHSARLWFLQNATESDIAKHFVAVSTNLPGVVEFGIDPANVFEFWDWVGGRYSLASAVGLSIMVAVGAENFTSMHEGMHAMDMHFLETPLEKNLPVMLALIGIWYTNFFGSETEAILPYDQNLQYLPSYLQQAAMESNGKMVSRDGVNVEYNTGTILWGGAGTNSQHSFFQLLHQGTRLIPADFILPINPQHKLFHHHDLLVANAIAQCEALMCGKDEQTVRTELAASGLSQDAIDRLTPFKIFNGNRPTNMILLKKLTPYSLGMLIAAYEHKIFVRGYLWNIFSFDQFGVELGKALAKALEPELTGPSKPELHDPSTNRLVELFKEYKTY